jgi:hypothetical protein
MNNIIKVLVFLSFLIQSSTLFAQECKKYKSGDEFEAEANKPLDIKAYEKWQKIELPQISFYVPDDFKRTNDGRSRHANTSFTYANKDFVLGVDLSNSAYVPNIFDKELPSYCERYSWVDNAFAYIWHSKPEKDYKKYESGVYFQFRERKDFGAGLYLISKTEETKEIGEKIFRSVSFKSKSK